MAWNWTGKIRGGRFRLNLQSIGQDLVQSVDLGRNAEIDGSVANLDDKSADSIWVNLCFVGEKHGNQFIPFVSSFHCISGFTNLRHNLQLLALAVLGSGNSPLETLDGLDVEFLGESNIHQQGEAIVALQEDAANCRGHSRG